LELRVGRATAGAELVVPESEAIIGTQDLIGAPVATNSDAAVPDENHSQRQLIENRFTRREHLQSFVYCPRLAEVRKEKLCHPAVVLAVLSFGPPTQRGKSRKSLVLAAGNYRAHAMIRA
jgi:hypothetical protein